MKLRIVTYEDSGRRPVIEHVFHGPEDVIEDIVSAHRKTDSFFRAATSSVDAEGFVNVTSSHGRFRGMQLRSEWHWSAGQIAY